jgi:hypothetical protein
MFQIHYDQRHPTSPYTDTVDLTNELVSTVPTNWKSHTFTSNYQTLTVKQFRHFMSGQVTPKEYSWNHRSARNSKIFIGLVLKMSIP